ncbi:MAG: hypothetical protein IKX03_00335 [Bacteroidales bacterium]|nr:hypothetical protein [Bacteroidales bacterium]MBR5055623.1 hypothetical protein [Bacteroidales bacterium]
MKKMFYALLFALTLCGCNKELENEINLLDRRITTLEERSAKMNETIKGLRTIVESFNNYDFIKDIKPVYNTLGTVVAYKITFTNSGTITIHNGTDADTPIIGVEKDRNGQYYWTVTYSDGVTNPIYLSNTGQLVYASSVTPEIKIEDGNWMISYDSGTTWNYLGKATGNSGNAFVNSIDNYNSFVRFNFIDGTSVNVPTETYYHYCETAVEDVNLNLESLKQLLASLEQKASVTDLIPIMDGKDTIGCKIIFTGDGVPESISFFNANTTTLPEIQAVKDETDGNYYWAIKYPGQDTAEWILCGEDKVRMNVIQGTSPLVGLERYEVDNLYYWTVSYDGGETYNWLLDDKGEMIAATSAEVSNPITSLIETSSLYYTMTVNGTVVVIPRYNSLGITLDRTEVKMHESDTCSVAYFIASADQFTEILPLAADPGFKCWIEKVNLTRGSLIITSPENFKSGTSSVSLLVSDGKGTMNTVVVNITYGE